MSAKSVEEKIANAAKNLIRIEKKSFYGGGSSHARLQHMRQEIDKVSNELVNNNEALADDNSFNNG